MRNYTEERVSVAGGVTPGTLVAASSFPPLPPTFPPGVDPETYRLDTVRHLLRQAAYFSLFSVHNLNVPNIPLFMPGNPQQLIGMQVNEQLHRFEVAIEPPTLATGLQATKAVGQGVARVHIRWLVIPDTFHAAPNREPPPTALNPARSQRFTMLDGQFSFDDRDQSGFEVLVPGGRSPPGKAVGRSSVLEQWWIFSKDLASSEATRAMQSSTAISSPRISLGSISWYVLWIHRGNCAQSRLSHLCSQFLIPTLARCF